MLVAPVSRTSIVLGKALGGGTVAVVQGLILVVAAPIVGVDLTVGRLLLLIVSLLLLAYAMTAFGIVLATRIERMESFQMVMTLVLQPMIFLSGAVFPLQDLPTWLAVITHLNPATYAVDLVRRSVLADAPGVEIAGWLVPILGTIAGVGGLALSYVLYGKRSPVPARLATDARPLYLASLRKFFVDEIYQAAIVRPLRWLAAASAFVDTYIVDGLVRLVGGLPLAFGSRVLAPYQNGLIQFYAAATALSVAALLLFLMLT